VSRLESLGGEACAVDVGLDETVAGAEVIFEKLEYPEAGVGLSGFVVHHADAGVLGGVADELGFADDVDAEPCELDVEIGVERACEIPVSTGFGFLNVTGDVVSFVIFGKVWSRDFTKCQ
jgi:hypothetical protein